MNLSYIRYRVEWIYDLIRISDFIMIRFQLRCTDLIENINGYL